MQHAHNPVDWYPWGSEAFQAAKDQDKPIFLSIGYATCHWCHVMERESFENQEIADLLNETFINIKVDREELPDVDALYMDFAQSMMAGSAGWPLNVILTPELEPFFAATYLPPFQQKGMMGLSELIGRISEVWHGEDKEKVIEQASNMVHLFGENMTIKGDTLPSKETVVAALEILYKLSDPIYGGLKGSPKFPVGYQYNFLLSSSFFLKDSRALFVVERTLDMMWRGGIYDHLGGGFARYSVDERWIIPHFEKMLCDNALLASLYTDAYRYTQKPIYRTIAREVLDYVLRDMTHPEGGFYSAEDADSEGHEGLFYTWKYEELEKVLGSRIDRFAPIFGVTQAGNFQGANVLYMPQSLEEYASHEKLDLKKLEEEIAEDRALLFKEREKRVHPFKDDKILTSWNGLMIHSLAEAGAAFNEPKYTAAAKKACAFIRTYLWNRKVLLRRFRDGEASHPGCLDDYAFLIRGLLTLFEKGEGSEFLDWALELTACVEHSFKEDQGAYYQNDGKDPAMILRKCLLIDGAEPAGNSIHAENLLRLYQITMEKGYLDQAEDVLRAVKGHLDYYSPGFFYHVMNLSRYYDQEAPLFIIALNDKLDHLEVLKEKFGEIYQPHRVTLFLYPADDKLREFLPNLHPYKAIQGKTTLYICKAGRCHEPITDVHLMIDAICGRMISL